MMRFVVLLLILLPGCISLDALLPFHNNIPCTQVTAEDCEVEDPWDAVCDSCEEFAAGPWWTFDYDWRPKTLGTLDTVRPIETTPQHVPFDTQDGTYNLNAWYLPSHGENTATKDTLILYNFGRFAGIEHYAPRVRFLHELGYAVFVWEYRGYGHSLPIDPNEEASSPATPDWMDDALLAFREAQKVAPDIGKIVVYGMSVGAMPGGEMASVFDSEICANVFEATYNSITAKIETNLSLSLPGSHLTSGLIENDVKLASITTPTLLLHGDQDDRIHLDEVQRLYENLPDDLPKQLVLIENAGHGLGGEGGVPEQGLEAYGQILQDFLAANAPACLSSD